MQSISDLLSSRKILFYATYLSREFVSSCIIDLLTPKCHLMDDTFPYVVLAWPQFWAFCTFVFCMSLWYIHWGALTSKGASLVRMNCCQHSRFCSGRSCGLVRQEVSDWIFALVVGTDIIGPILRVCVPRPCGGVGMASRDSLLDLLLGLDLFCLDQGVDPVIEFIWVD